MLQIHREMQMSNWYSLHSSSLTQSKGMADHNKTGLCSEESDAGAKVSGVFVTLIVWSNMPKRGGLVYIFVDIINNLGTQVASFLACNTASSLTRKWHTVKMSVIPWVTILLHLYGLSHWRCPLVWSSRWRARWLNTTCSPRCQKGSDLALGSVQILQMFTGVYRFLTHRRGPSS